MNQFHCEKCGRNLKDGKCNFCEDRPFIIGDIVRIKGSELYDPSNAIWYPITDVENGYENRFTIVSMDYEYVSVKEVNERHERHYGHYSAPIKLYERCR